MAPQASKKCGFLPPDHKRIASYTSHDIYPEQAQQLLPEEASSQWLKQSRLETKRYQLSTVEDIMASDKLTTAQVAKGPRLPTTSNCCQIRGPETSLKPRQKIKLLIKTTSISSMAVPGIADHIGKTKTGMTIRAEQVGQILVIEDPELDVSFEKKITKALEEVEYEEPTCDWIRAFKEFKERNGDHYDFVAMIPDTHVDKLTSAPLGTSMPASGNIQSHHVYVFNDVAGINLPRYHRRGLFESTRLQGIAALDPINVAPIRAQRLHEIGHRWGAYVDFKKRRSDRSALHDIIDFSGAHWAWHFHKDGSCLGGGLHPWHDWVRNSDGSFTNWLFDQNSEHFGYCPLDLYLMGMLAPSEVPPFYYIDNLQPAATASNPDRFTGRRVNLRVKNIIWANGPRQPHAAHSQRSFRLGCMVLTKDLGQGKQLAQTLEQHRIAVTEQFREATRSRGMLDTYLYSDSYDGIYIQDNELDRGNEPSIGNFWNSPDIWVRRNPDKKKTHEGFDPNQDNWIHVRVRNNGRKDSGNITVNLFQADHAATEFLYPQDWIWDQDHRIDESKPITSVPAGGEEIVCFEWDKGKVALIGTGYPTFLAEILPIHPTKTKLRYVWEDRRIAQKNATSIVSQSGSTGVEFPFFIGTSSLSKRSVVIRVVQKHRGPVGELSLDIDKKKQVNRLSQPKKRKLSLKERGGYVKERGGRTAFVIENPIEGGDITLPLMESKRKRLILRFNWGKEPLATDTAFEITQLNEQHEVVGGLDLIVKNGRSDHI